jgi:hypothetical protein
MLSVLFACVAGFAAGGLAVETGSAEIPAGSVGEVLRGPRFQLRRVEFTGLHALAPGDLSGALALRGTEALIDVDPDALCARVEAHRRVERCAAMRLPPDRLLVDVEERVPVARLGSTAYGVDARGDRLPLVAGEGEALPRIDGNPAWALPFVAAAGERGLDVASVDARGPDDLLVSLPGQATRLRVGRDLDRALRNWDEIRRRGLARDWAPREIDLRFEGSAVLRDLSGTEGG